MEDPNFFQLVLYFMVFAIGGWIIEVIVYLVGWQQKHKFVNRGFLFGPWLPIYGFGGLLVLKYSAVAPRDNYFVIFLVCAAGGAAIEYLTSWLLEKIFHMRWWDYSKTRKIQLNGRIALLNTLGFGLGGCVLIRWIIPLTSNIISKIPELWQVLLALALLVAILADATVSIYANLQVKNMGLFEKIVGNPAGQIKKYAELVIMRLVLGPEKMARRAKSFSEDMQKRWQDFSEDMEKRRKDFSKDIEKRRKDFSKDIEKRRKNFSSEVKRKKK